MDILTRPGRKARPSWAVYVRWQTGKLDRILTTTPARIASKPDCQVLAAAILPTVATRAAVWPKPVRR